MISASVEYNGESFADEPPYILIEDDSGNPRNLERMVNIAIKNGYQPLGGVVIDLSKNRVGNSAYLYQTMFRPNDKK